MPSVEWRGPDDVLLEMPDSPQWDLGDKITATRTYRGTYALCLSSALAKGTLGTGDMTGYRVANCQVKREPRTIGRLTITWEANDSSAGQPLPPDEFGIDPLEVNPKLERHPRYESLIDKDRDNIRTALNALDEAARTGLSTNLPPLAQELLKKLRTGFENYYLSGFTYDWTFASWSEPSISEGGFIQSPGGPLGSLLAGTGMVFLRKADSLKFTGQNYRLTRSWLGGPAKYIDSDIYTG